MTNLSDKQLAAASKYVKQTRPDWVPVVVHDMQTHFLVHEDSTAALLMMRIRHKRNLRPSRAMIFLVQQPNTDEVVMVTGCTTFASLRDKYAHGDGCVHARIETENVFG